MNLIDEIVSELIETQKADRILNPEQKKEKTEKDLAILSERGRYAMDLENSEAFKKLIEPEIKETLKTCIKSLIIDGLHINEIEKNVLIAKMQEALSPYTMIKRAKEMATTANKALEVFEEREKKKDERVQEIAKREKIAKQAIARKTKQVNKSAAKPGRDTTEREK